MKRLIVYILLLGMASSACGGEERINEPPRRERRNRGGGRNQATPELPVVNNNRSGVSRMEWPDDFRDPFSHPAYLRELEDEDSAQDLGASLNQMNQVYDAGPLAYIGFQRLELVGILSRSVDPVAMFTYRDGSSNKAVFMRIGDRIGPDAAGVVVDITANEVVVEYNYLGQEPSLISRTLRDPFQSDDIVFEPF
ncbi:MAG: hypothetical protein KC561_04890 [Myxococcales bacterium]|nr:hypothetical protein [Myxococcales bacterium]